MPPVLRGRRKEAATDVNGNSMMEMHGQTCEFCKEPDDGNVLYGPWYQIDGLAVHLYCMLLATDCHQKGDPDTEGIVGFFPVDIQSAVKKAKSKKCDWCQKPGAASKCNGMKCTNRYHLPCGIKAGCLHQYTGYFHTYCYQHLPSFMESEKEPLDTKCLICLHEMTSADRAVERVPTCCGRFWFHRTCMQTYACKFGYKLKCADCDENTEEYRELLRSRGIFVPDNDTTHAMEEAIRAELVQLKCNAQICWCDKPLVREYVESCESSEWSIRDCVLCGSGSHRACDLKKLKEFMCHNCEELEYARRRDQSNTTENVQQPLEPSNVQIDEDIAIDDDPIGTGAYEAELQVFLDHIPTGSSNCDLMDLIVQANIKEQLTEQRAQQQCPRNNDNYRERVECVPTAKRTDEKRRRQNELIKRCVPQAFMATIVISDSSDDENNDCLYEKMSQQRTIPPVSAKQEAELEYVKDFDVKDNKQLTEIRGEVIFPRFFASFDQFGAL